MAKKMKPTNKKIEEELESQLQSALAEQMINKLNKQDFIGESGGGMVKVHMKINEVGQDQIVKIEIEDQLYNKEDKQFMIDLLISAINDGHKKINEGFEDFIDENQDSFMMKL